MLMLHGVFWSILHRYRSVALTTDEPEYFYLPCASKNVTMRKIAAPYIPTNSVAQERNLRELEERILLLWCASSVKFAALLDRTVIHTASFGTERGSFPSTALRLP